MSLDQDLRRTLAHHAEAFTAPVDLRPGIARRRRRIRHRRRIIGAGLVGLLLVVIAPLILVQPGPPDTTPALVAPAPIVAFPVTPRWEPHWAGPPSFTYERGQRAVLRYDPTFPTGAVLTLTVSRSDPGLSGESVIVGGESGTLTDTATGIDLAWQGPAGWLLVSATAPATRDDVLAYAQGIDNTPSAMLAPFALARIPVGAELASFSRSSMVYARSGRDDVTLTVTLVRRAAVDGPGEGRAVDEDGGTAFYRMIDQGRAIRVWVSGSWGLATASLGEIAEGVDAMSTAVTEGE